jgi:SAM-dependent methyltransferase
MRSSPEHWNQIFKTKEAPSLGWYEHDPSQTLAMLADVPDRMSAKVFLPGAGTSVLVDQLLLQGNTVILNDISREALDRLKARIGDRRDALWLCQDIATPLPPTVSQVDLWIDRAVLHFLIEESDIAGYFNNLRALLRPGGFALLAEFSLSGAPQCAGLPVHRYSVDEFGMRLGPDFKLLRQSDYTFTNPAGAPRPYLYALYQRQVPRPPS